MAYDYRGTVFGKLIAKSIVGNSGNGERLYRCLCQCGNYIIVQGYYLKSGKTKSCGCLHKQNRINAKTTHGMSQNNQQYKTWKQFKHRNRICEEWKDFNKFLLDVGKIKEGWFITTISHKEVLSLTNYMIIRKG